MVTSLILAGCGQSGTQSGKQNQETTVSTSAAKEAIKIGLVPDLSGPTMGVGSALNAGFSTYIKWVNDNGGVNGRKIDLITEDGKYDMQREVSLYKKLRQQGVLTVAHAWSTGANSALAPEYPKDKNVVFPGSRAGFLFNPEVNPYVFLTSPSYDIGYYAMMDYAVQKKPGAKIVVVHPDNTYGQDALKWLQERGKAKGAKVISEILNFDAVDATTQAIRAKSLKPDFVFLVLSGRPTKTFLDAGQKVGLDVPMVANFNTAEQLLIELAGDIPIIKNITGVAFYATQAEDVPGIKEIMKVGRQYGVEKNKLYEQWYAMGWTDAMVLVEGLKRAGDNLSGEKLKEAIETIKDLDTGGITAPLSYGPAQHTGGAQIKYTKVNLQKGFWEPVSDWIIPEK
jgi:branched-chain amino acid transport system substrate-binding protein